MDSPATKSRRRFLAELGSGAALLGLGATRPVGAALSERQEFGLDNLVGPRGPDWKAIRQCFQLRKGLAYLNNGTLGPCPRYVIQESMKAWGVAGGESCRQRFRSAASEDGRGASEGSGFRRSIER